MKKSGMIRVAAISPKVKVGNTEYNSQEILRCIEEAHSQNAGLMVFPALCLTGVSCGDLFSHDLLYDSQLRSLNEIALATKKISSALVLGMYLRTGNSYTECAAFLQNGLIAGIVPKYYPSTDAFRSNRWFSSGNCIQKAPYTVTPFDYPIPFGKILFADEENGVSIGIDADTDSKLPLSPGSELCVAGAHIIANPGASPELIGSSSLRRQSLIQKSRDGLCAHVYSSCGALESSSCGIYSGHCVIAESGSLLCEDSRIILDGKIVMSDIDYSGLCFEKSLAALPAASDNLDTEAMHYVKLRPLPVLGEGSPMKRVFSPTPFIPSESSILESNCREAFNIQSAALARRLLHTGAGKAVLGVSGGLDSTLALLVTVQAMKVLGRPSSDVITVTMPGFGTSGKTYANGAAIMKALGTEIREIPIKEAVLLHFDDIGHDPQVKNTVYENVQARERTQILMDIANMEKGIQVGTGDLSEAALGWSTYNGDHMSMYNVNAGLPKTFIRAMITWFIECVAGQSNKEHSFSSDDAGLARALRDVLDTPVSPELLPPDENDAISQKTEDKVGPYVLHDFFLYHTIRRGASPSRLLYMAKSVFAGEYDEDCLRKWLEVFYRRFFAFQFKRSCVPDSPRIGTVNLSPREGFMMPSDADGAIWLEDLKGSGGIGF
ncbi:NAD(+) synthase [Bacillota bacterium]